MIDTLDREMDLMFTVNSIGHDRMHVYRIWNQVRKKAENQRGKKIYCMALPALNLLSILIMNIESRRTHGLEPAASRYLIEV